MINNHFIQHFLTAAQHYADKPALYFNKKTYDYQTINLLSDNIAKIISKFALPKETIVPLVLERTPQIIITMIGILKAGCAFLPISPSSPCSRIEYILEETKSKLVFCDLSVSFAIPRAELINPNTLVEIDDNHFTSFCENDDLAYVRYTSGSTGKPKGVMIEHGSMMNLFSSLTEILSLSNDDLFLALTDYTFDISLIELLMPLTIGASIVLTEHGAVADGKKISQ
ncbi:AMP-binding protein [uncultured Legionella sp.]|mgnify:CR=1 FL=1|uniref:AMP-binding protein n=1 Tax=uncultured Legionella sp. TaxID=210934 RepID=UPI0026324E13|nr:AMP-binding protein [uncultured Legionella sp.]